MQIETLAREFSYNGAKLADPAPAFTLQQVRDFYSQTYPELTNAEIEGPVIKGARNIYTFRRAVGTKGLTMRELSKRLRTDTLNQGQRLPTAIGKYDATLARSVARVASPNDNTAERLRLPSTLVPLLP
ncbi:PRTRC system protein C [Burkholderia stagnalis]|uniref:PRTRC system protein C n=1 Tax=Burkholderia stagnalis TaxID=1503054 RepID=UPI000F5D6023|nr:PRTRC system protein C [Burkholderia stagnalis]RQY60817.1 PRTRC system protein C [Burkholderia stagnalis]